MKFTSTGSLTATIASIALGGFFVASSMGQAQTPPIQIEEPAVEEKMTAEKIQKLLKKVSPTAYELSGMKLDLQAKELKVPAIVKITKGPLEYVLTHEMGAAHEALFVTKNNPFEVKVALLLLGFKESETFFNRQDPTAFPRAAENPKLDPATLFDLVVEYPGKDGAPQQAPVEKWVKNLQTGTHLVPGPWVFNGSFFTPEGDLAALAGGNILSLYLDPVALANNPRRGNDLDDIWQPMPDLPVENTPVTIIFRKPKPAVAPPTSREPSSGPNTDNPESTKK